MSSSAARRPPGFATSRSRCRPTCWRSGPPTAPRPAHVDPQPSARQLLDGGPVAIAIAPAGFAHVGEYAVNSIAAVAEDGDPCPEETAEALAARLGATVAARGTGGGDLIIVGSKTGTVTGRVTISAAAEYLIELARSPVIVLPRGVALPFG